MLEVLSKHLSVAIDGCVVAKWIDTLKDEEKKAFIKVKDLSENINIATLFNDLNKQTELPFKLTAFRSHLRGYCTCPK